jgi:hypothetical protein
VLNELKPERKSWAEVKALEANRTRWRTFTRAHAPQRSKRNIMMMMMSNQV